jgi:crotonobetainyl-CoA:carnitine CoA-transferase CaiB-like acyl-CoA transferase
MGSAHPNIALYDKYQCADGEIFLGIINDGQFQRFCQVLGISQVSQDPRFATNPLRVQHRQLLHPMIEQALRNQNKALLCDMLMKASVPCAPVNSVPEAFEQAHAKARGSLIANGDYRGIATPVKLMGTPAVSVSAPPDFAQHAQAILKQAGYRPQEIEALQSDGVVQNRLKVPGQSIDRRNKT